jgi:hypothetical protein
MSAYLLVYSITSQDYDIIPLSVYHQLLLGGT